MSLGGYARTLIGSTAAPADGAPGTKTHGPHQAGLHPLRDQVNVSRCLQAVPIDKRAIRMTAVSDFLTHDLVVTLPGRHHIWQV